MKMNKLKWMIAGLFSVSLSVGAQVNFRQISLAQALQEAKTEQKPIFMDCQTKWCGSCKVMAREVFSQSDVGDFFNVHFVNVLMDMETPEGKEINELFGVHAYPTFFIINEDGKLQHRIVGARPKAQFLKLVKDGMVEETSLQRLDSLYKIGQLPKEAEELYVEELNNASMDQEVRRVATDLFDRLSGKERVKSSNWYLYDNMEMLYPSDAMFAFLVNHQTEFARTVGDSVVNQKLSSIYRSVLLNTTQKEPIKSVIDASYDAMSTQLAVVDFPDKPLIELWLRYNMACRQKDTDTLFDIWEHHLAELPYLVQVQIPFAFDFIVQSGDKKMLRRYVAIGEKLLPYIKVDGFKKVVKETFDKYKTQL